MAETIKALNIGGSEYNFDATQLNGFNIDDICNKSGENIIVGSSTASIVSNWSSTGWSGSITTYDVENGIYEVHAYNGWRTHVYEIPSEYLNTTLSYSFDVYYDSEKSTQAINGEAGITSAKGYGAGIFAFGADILTKPNTWVHYSGSFTPTDTNKYFGFFLRCTDSSSKSTYIRVKNLKIEKGNLSSIWTPNKSDLYFSELSNSNNKLQITIGQTTRNLIVDYSGFANAANTANKISQSTYYYSGNVMKNTTTSGDIFSDNAKANFCFPAFMESHPTWSGYADVLNFTGYCVWGGTQFATQYNSSNPRVAIRKFIQDGNKWGNWNEFVMFNNIKTANSITHSEWSSTDTGTRKIATLNFLSYWNGAHTSSGDSNLQYCDRGRFGTIVTKSDTDYMVAGDTSHGTHITTGAQEFTGVKTFSNRINANSGIRIGTTDNDIGWFLNSNRITAGTSTARDVNVGSLLVSNAWADSSKVPTNGIYSKGDIKIGDGYLKVTKSSYGTLTIGSQNTAYTHYETTGGTHWFNKNVAAQGDFYGGSSYNRRLAYVDELPTNNNQLTNGAGYITSSGSITGNAATATLATSAKRCSTKQSDAGNSTANYYKVTGLIEHTSNRQATYIITTRLNENYYVSIGTCDGDNTKLPQITRMHNSYSKIIGFTYKSGVLYIKTVAYNNTVGVANITNLSDTTVAIANSTESEYNTGTVVPIWDNLNSGNSSVSKSGETLTVKISGTECSLTNTWPTKSDLGLSNVDNTADANKSVNYAATAGGVAWDNVSGKPTAFSPAAHDHTVLKDLDNYSFKGTNLPVLFPQGISCGFVQQDAIFPSYGSVLTCRTYSGGGGTLQLYAPYSATYGGERLRARFGNYDSANGNSWTALKEIAWLEDIPSLSAYSKKASAETLSGAKTFSAAATFSAGLSSGGNVTVTGKVSANLGFYEESDERLKSFKDPIKVDLEKLSKLRKSYFTFNSDPDNLQIGVSAQEIQSLYPEIVSENENGNLTVAYDKLSVIALAAVDKLSTELNTLKDELQQIKAHLNLI